ncbi:probable glutamate receptor [Penaeus monodon]|uniref:probable glutamate receptor n=1 Tax=Penaeus monodon TaxID=6687 RepID=UPI0018A7DBAE|nr:probable glutamate receptor [Penaeus monodon]
MANPGSRTHRASLKTNTQVVLVVLVTLVVLVVAAKAMDVGRPPDTPTTLGMVAFLRDFIRHYHFDHVNFFTTLRERDRLHLLALQPLQMSFRKVPDDATLWQEESPFSAHKILNIVLVESVDWLRFANATRPQNGVNWLVIGEHVHAMDTLSLPLNNKVTFAEPEGGAVSAQTRAEMGAVARVALVEVYRAGPSVGPNVQVVGHWESGGGGRTLLRAPAEDRSERRFDLMGVELRCLTHEWPPVTINQLVDESGTQEVTGWMGGAWDVLKERLNFTSTCRRPRDEDWGTLTEGRWSGMVGELAEGLADVIVAPLDYTVARSRVVDFVIPVVQVRYIMVVQRANQLAGVWESYTQEFGCKSWAAVVLFLVLCPCVLSLVSKSSPSESTRVTLLDAVTCTLGFLGQQGTSLSFTSAPSRIFFLASFVTTVLLYCHYTSALFSSLAITTNSQPFRDLRGILENGKYRFGFTEGISVENDFKDSANYLYQQVWHRLVMPPPSGLMHDDAAGLARVRQEKYVHMMDRTNFVYLTRGECDLEMLPRPLFSYPSGMAFRKRSPYKEVFSRALLTLMDSGVTKKLIDKWQPKTSLCKSLDIQPLTLTHVFTAFLLLGAGMFLSFSILAGEVLYKNLQQGTSAKISWRREIEQKKSGREEGINNDGLRTTHRLTWFDRPGFKKRV